MRAGCLIRRNGAKDGEGLFVRANGHLLHCSFSRGNAHGSEYAYTYVCVIIQQLFRAFHSICRNRDETRDTMQWRGVRDWYLILVQPSTTAVLERHSLSILPTAAHAWLISWR
jgi:hypothetical protein